MGHPAVRATDSACRHSIGLAGQFVQLAHVDRHVRRGPRGHAEAAGSGARALVQRLAQGMLWAMTC